MVDMEKLSCLDSSKDDDIILPGFRFHPTDEELVGFYLRRKVEKKHLSIELIKHIDIYKYDPWDLPKVSTVGDKEWYFFCIRERKYRNSIRPNRVTGSGFWKATGIDRPIYSVGEPHDCIGLKKSLVYYRGSAGKGTKTDWMMHEFRLPPGGKSAKLLVTNSKNSSSSTADEEAEIWTLCRIFKRNVSYKKFLPNWRETASSMKQNNPADSNSQTCSFESSNINNKYSSFGPSIIVQQKEKKPVIISHVDETLPDQLSSITLQAPAAVLYSNLPNLNSGNDQFFRDGTNWDELGRMLEFSSDSALLYGCR